MARVNSFYTFFKKTAGAKAEKFTNCQVHKNARTLTIFYMLNTLFAKTLQKYVLYVVEFG